MFEPAEYIDKDTGEKVTAFLLTEGEIGKQWNRINRMPIDVAKANSITHEAFTKIQCYVDHWEVGGEATKEPRIAGAGSWIVIYKKCVDVKDKKLFEMYFEKVEEKEKKVEEGIFEKEDLADRLVKATERGNGKIFTQALMVAAEICCKDCKKKLLNMNMNLAITNLNPKKDART